MGPYSFGYLQNGRDLFIPSSCEALELLLSIRCCERCREETTLPQFLGDRMCTPDTADSRLGDPRLSGAAAFSRGGLVPYLSLQNNTWVRDGALQVVNI